MSHQLLHPKVLKALNLYNIQAATISCDPGLADTAAFCEHYGYRLDQSANTIIVASRTENPIFVACLILATTKLDVNKKVRQLVGTRRLSFATAEQTEQITDMLIGGVTAIGICEDLPLYVDAAVMRQDSIVIGGGNRSSKLVLRPKELSKLPNFQLIDDLALARF